MKLKKAIKTQNRYLKNPCPVLPLEVKVAMELGIEALKRFHYFRQGHFNIHLDLLPGETEEFPK